MQLIQHVFNIKKFKKFFVSLKASLLHIAYPSKCLHCRILLPPEEGVLCDSCSTLLELIIPDLRCPSCFNPFDEDMLFRCEECTQNPSLFYRTGAVFDYTGPAASLVKQLKYGNSPYLASGMGAFFIAQLENLNWPFPDAIVPVPLSFMRRIDRGYNQSELLANEIGKFLNRPVWKVLKRKNGEYSQASLSYEKRKLLDATNFKLKGSPSIENKALLLIDDVMTTGTTLQCCAETLLEGNCGLLYAMTFCRT